MEWVHNYALKTLNLLVLMNDFLWSSMYNKTMDRTVVVLSL